MRELSQIKSCALSSVKGSFLNLHSNETIGFIAFVSKSIQLSYNLLSDGRKRERER